MNLSTIRKAADLWNLGIPKNVRVLHGGLQTPKMLVETEAGKFVISRHNLSNAKTLIAKSPRSFLYEIDLLVSLKGLPVPYFLRSARGTYLERIGKDWVTVDTFVQGAKQKTLTPAMARELGAFLGEFHTQGSKFKRTLLGRRKFYHLSPAVMRTMHGPARRQKNPKLSAVVEEVRLGVERTRLSRRLPKGPIHVDIKPDNELWKGKHLAAVLDFGNFYVDTLMIDVGKTIMWNCLRKGKLDRGLIRAFVQGYESKRTFSKAEKEYLDDAILFAIYSHIWVDLYHVPLGYVPESYTLSLVRAFLPVARRFAGKIG